jgi:tetratricopeptide (TPR) repeat protein
MILRHRLNLAASLFLLAGLAAPAPAQEASPEETLLYSAWHVASEAKDTAKAQETAEQYLKQFPNGAYAAYLKQWIAQGEGQRFNEAIAKKDAKTLVELGKAKLAAEPENLDYALALALNLRRFDLFGSPSSDERLDDIRGFSQKTIELLEKGKLPTGVDPAKFSKEQTLGWLHQNLAIVAGKQKRDEDAIAAYKKSSALDPKNKALNTYNALFLGSLLKDKYDAAVARYKELPEEQRTAAEPAAEVKAVLDEANAHADATLEVWARFLALSEGQAAYADTRARVEKTASDLWAYRHPDDAQGLAAYVAKVAGS